MTTNDDEELERIKRMKLRKMMKDFDPKTQEKPTLIDRPVEVTDATFRETIQKHPLVVIDCWASWCSPCQMVAPVIEEMAQDYAGRILFGKLNVDANREVPIRYQIMSIPTLLLFKNGEPIANIVGFRPKEELKRSLEGALG